VSKLYHRRKTVVFVLVPLQIFVLVQLSAVEPYYLFKFTQPHLCDKLMQGFSTGVPRVVARGSARERD
jgi:hypothetical protein